ncbi:MAG TPA: TonB family protein [Vicinamibacterales bacterium]
MPRAFTLVSVSIHAFALGSVYVAQTLSSGPLPLLRDAIAFNNQMVTPIKIADIPLTRQGAQSRTPEPSESPSAPPLDAPPSLTPETGRENEISTNRSSGPLTGVEQGVNAGGPVGVIPGAAAAPPEPAPQQPLHLHSGIQAPRKIVDIKPIYPALAQTAHQEGVVILETIIDARGAVETVRVLRGYPLLNQAAIDAVTQWRFTPALLNGQPVPVVMTVTVNFSLK